MRVKTDFYVIMTCKQEKPFNQNGSPHLRVRAAVFLHIDSIKKGRIFIEKFTQISLDFFVFRDIIKWLTVNALTVLSRAKGDKRN